MVEDCLTFILSENTARRHRRDSFVPADSLLPFLAVVVQSLHPGYRRRPILTHLRDHDRYPASRLPTEVTL